MNFQIEIRPSKRKGKTVKAWLWSKGREDGDCAICSLPYREDVPGEVAFADEFVRRWNKGCADAPE